MFEESEENNAAAPWSKRGIGAAAAAVLGTIVLGAIGSGLWERLGSPAFDFLSRLTISAIDSAIGSYKDSIYREAAFGFHEHSANFVYGVLQILPPLVYLGLLAMHPYVRLRRRYSRLSTSSPPVLPPDSPLTRQGKGRRVRRPLSFYLLLLLTLGVISSALVSVSRTSYTVRVVTFAETSLDRLAPYLTEQDEEELRAQFRSVRSAQDYYTFYERVAQLLAKFGLPNVGQHPI